MFLFSDRSLAAHCCVKIEDPHDGIVVVKNHRFKTKSYANMTWCDSSLKPLFGLQRQGLQCTGLLLHHGACV